MTELSVTFDQARVVGALMEHMRKGDGAHAIVLKVDVGAGDGALSMASTIPLVELHVGGALLLLRYSLALLAAGAECAKRAAVHDALQVAVAHMEAAGIAEPDHRSRRGLQ